VIKSIYGNIVLEPAPAVYDPFKSMKKHPEADYHLCNRLLVQKGSGFEKSFLNSPMSRNVPCGDNYPFLKYDWVSFVVLHVLEI